MRPIKLDIYDHPFTCPICDTKIVFVSMHTTIVLSRRACPSCKGELLIHAGKASAVSAKKPPSSAKKSGTRARKTAARN